MAFPARFSQCKLEFEHPGATYSAAEPSQGQSEADEAFAEAYELAVIGAARKTGLPESDFPKSAPYRFEQAVDEDFWPE